MCTIFVYATWYCSTAAAHGYNKYLMYDSHMHNIRRCYRSRAAAHGYNKYLTPIAFICTTYCTPLLVTVMPNLRLLQVYLADVPPCHHPFHSFPLHVALRYRIPVEKIIIMKGIVGRNLSLLKSHALSSFE